MIILLHLTDCLKRYIRKLQNYQAWVQVQNREQEVRLKTTDDENSVFSNHDYSCEKTSISILTGYNSEQEK